MIIEAAQVSEKLDETAHRAIRDYLERRGLQVQSVERWVWDWRLLVGRGVSNLARSYRAASVSPAGVRATHIFAYEPAGWATFEHDGLKRWANGVWFAAE